MKLIYKDDISIRIDKFLVQQDHPNLYSRSFIDKLIVNSFVEVNGKTVKKSHLLKSGDEIVIELPEMKKPEITAEDIPLDIVYEDSDLAIINKPAGITVHPAPGNEKGTIVNALMHHFQQNLSSGSATNRPGIVHRLDKETSGLLIVAKNDRIHSLMSQMFQERKVRKYYKAITVGIPGEEEGTIRTLISRSKSDRKKMAVSIEGKEAVTHYKIEKYYQVFSLVEVSLETGRTHQIRVHFSHINCPILGDQTYSSLKRTVNMIPYNYQKKVKYLLANHLKRQALHACRLEFTHPITGKEIKVESKLPNDMLYSLEWLDKFFID